MSATLTRTSPFGATVDVLHHAEVDDADVQLRIEDTREDAADVVGRGRRGKREVGIRSSAIKTVWTLKICPMTGYRQARMDMLAVLKALGDETRFSMYRELASSTHPLSAHDLADQLGIHANTVRLHLERLREAGLVEVEAVHRGTVGRPQHVYALASGAPGLGFDPPSYTLLAGLLAALAERMGADAEEADGDRSRAGASRPAAAPVPARAPRRSSPSSNGSASIRSRRTTTTAMSRSPSCTARSGSWPRPIRSWCATSTAASARVS